VVECKAPLEPHQPVWPLIAEFCNAYYGDAGPDIVAYLHAFSAPLSQPGVEARINDTCFVKTAGYLSDDAVHAADAALTKAEARPLDDIKRRRIRTVRLTLQEIDIEKSLPRQGASDAERTAYSAKLAAYIADAKTAGITYLNKTRTLDEYQKRFELLASTGQEP